MRIRTPIDLGALIREPKVGDFHTRDIVMRSWRGCNFPEADAWSGE
jgi:hypothetical protein